MLILGSRGERAPSPDMPYPPKSQTVRVESGRAVSCQSAALIRLPGQFDRAAWWPPTNRADYGPFLWSE